MNNNKTSSTGSAGISSSSALQIVFIVLKLCKVINWSWWWVLSPTWISIVFVLFLVLVLICRERNDTR